MAAGVEDGADDRERRRVAVVVHLRNGQGSRQLPSTRASSRNASSCRPVARRACERRLCPSRTGWSERRRRRSSALHGARGDACDGERTGSHHASDSATVPSRGELSSSSPRARGQAAAQRATVAARVSPAEASIFRSARAVERVAPLFTIASRTGGSASSGSAGDRVDLERRADDEQQAGPAHELERALDLGLGQQLAEHDDVRLEHRAAALARRHRQQLDARARSPPGGRRRGS